LPDRSKESTQTKRDTLVLQVGGWVGGPAPHRTGKKNTHAKKNLDKGSEKKDGLSKKRHKARKRVNELRYMECSRYSRKNGRNNARIGKLKMDVIGLTETKRKGTGSEIVGGYVHLYSGVSKDRRTERGVSILIKKIFKKGIANWEAVNENITVNLNYLGIKITVFCVYAP